MDNNKLNNLRHSCSHLLAAAVMELWPDTKRTIGPAIENGFYFDFEFTNPITDVDFPKIEQKMHELVKTWKSFEKHELSSGDAKKEYPSNPYKYELIDEFAKDSDKISFYKSGDYWDLCKGGHVERPEKELKHFKLLSVAGAYWRGDSKNKMLTRIYGTIFPTKEELDNYLWQIEEIKKRDNRKIGKELGLFVMSDEVGGGLPLFTPKGTIIRKQIENYLVRKKEKNGYKFVWTPHITKSHLYHISKHWGKYDAMYSPMEIDGEEYVLKPMNCPHHFMIYKSTLHSYKELPLRYAENATVYRNEKSGELNGLLRVRASTTDDTHSFVKHDQIANELNSIINIIIGILNDFGFKEYRARISFRDKNAKNKYIGEYKLWDVAENALVQTAKDNSLDYFLGPGEAAFYGPKIDFMIKDAIGREWQCSTVQLDFAQPMNFDLSYIDESGQHSKPAVIHIAMIGSVERFMGILIEQYIGVLPLWLSPVQVAVLPISEKHLEYSRNIKDILNKAKIRVELNEDNKSIGYKIRQSTLQKTPYMVIIGDKEIQGSNQKDLKLLVSIRTREGKDLGQVNIYEFVENLKTQIEKYVS